MKENDNIFFAKGIMKDIEADNKILVNDYIRAENIDENYIKEDLEKDEEGIFREIEFRGKRIDNEEWACGHFMKSNFKEKTWYIVADILSSQLLPIIPETLGQYTGLKDCKQVKIFEGDVLRHVNGKIRVNGEWIDNLEYYVVEYKGCCFYPVSMLSLVSNSLEVVGNIHDNPDLLKMIFGVLK